MEVGDENTWFTECLRKKQEMKLCVDIAVNCVNAFWEAYQEHGSAKYAFTEPEVHRLLLWLIFRTTFLHRCNVVKYAHTTLDVLLQDLLVYDVYKEASMGFLEQNSESRSFQ